MARHSYLRILLLVMLVFIVLYFLLNKNLVIRENLTPGPPTLLTLQNDTEDLDSRLTDLKSQFDKMSEQAKAGADASAQARAQMNLLKKS
jgi:hypothetical protein